MRCAIRRVPFFVLFVAVMIFALSHSRAVGAFKNLSEGMEIPDLMLKTLDGQDFSLKSLAEKDAAVVVFFATWSERSIHELEDLQELKKELEGKNFEVLAINVEHEQMSEEETAKVKEAVEKAGVSFPVLLDDGLLAFRTFGVVAVPSTAIFKKGGILHEAVNGYPTFAKEEIKETAQVLLGLKKPEKKVAEVAGYKPKREALLNYNLGRRLYSFGMLRKAEMKLKAAANADEKFAKPLVLLGKIYLEMSLKKRTALLKAKQAFEKALAASPEDEGAKTGLALYHVRKGNLAEAEKLVDQVLEKNPGYTHALALKALILGKKKDAAGAKKFAEEAVSLAPMDPEILALAGFAFDSAGSFDRACEYYRKAGEKLGF
ncbi:MAG: hypothetical protein D6713_07940 [Deltaproteobacteria bacterium]|nr:MAG: hypothetical protein D6713_07940 [Deltaproteobacteria bacterium]